MFKTSFSHILQGLGETIENAVYGYPIVNRDIKNFSGSILIFGGTEQEVARLQSRQLNYMNTSTKAVDAIYTVNLDKTANPDLVADINSIHQLDSLPDKRFDLVYISAAPTSLKIFENASRLLKNDGLLLVYGNEMVTLDNGSRRSTETLETMSCFPQRKVMPQVSVITRELFHDPQTISMLASKSKMSPISKRVSEFVVTDPAIAAVFGERVSCYGSHLGDNLQQEVTETLAMAGIIETSLPSDQQNDPNDESKECLMNNAGYKPFSSK